MSLLSGLGNIFSGMFSGGAGMTAPILESTPAMVDDIGNKTWYNTADTVTNTNLGSNTNLTGQSSFKSNPLVQNKVFDAGIKSGELVPSNNPTLTAGSGKDGGILSGLGDMFTGENILKGIEMWQAKKNDDRNYKAYKTQVNNNAQKDNNKRDRSKHLSKSMYGTTDEGISGKDMEYIG